jgi:hypothetical protein
MQQMQVWINGEKTKLKKRNKGCLGADKTNG